MSNLVDSLGPLVGALLTSFAVALLLITIIRTLSGGGVQGIMAAMPKYTLRSHSTPEQLVKAQQVDESSLFLRIGRRFLTEKYQTWMLNNLAAAGTRGSVALAALLTKKVMYAVIGAMVGFLFLAKSPSLGLAALLVLTVLGYFVPDLLVVSDAQKRDEALERGLPDAIDLLNLCVESGLSFENAISRVSLSLSGPVAEEFGALMAEIQLGKSRVEAMAELSERTRSKSLRRFLGALLQVDRLGVPISGVLAEQAREMRAVRKDRAREQGQKVTIKILMPLMLCFLPAMFIIVLGPALYQLVKTMILL
ncbi:MAG: type II secretion system F family protein [Micrococcales bacterium]